jgi:hypothetical protein
VFEKHVVHPAAHAQKYLAHYRNMVPMLGVDSDFRDDTAGQLVAG